MFIGQMRTPDTEQFPRLRIWCQLVTSLGRQGGGTETRSKPSAEPGPPPGLSTVICGRSFSVSESVSWSAKWINNACPKCLISLCVCVCVCVCVSLCVYVCFLPCNNQITTIIWVFMRYQTLGWVLWIGGQKRNTGLLLWCSPSHPICFYHGGFHTHLPH